MEVLIKEYTDNKYRINSLAILLTMDKDYLLTTVLHTTGLTLMGVYQLQVRPTCCKMKYLCTRLTALSRMCLINIVIKLLPALTVMGINLSNRLTHITANSIL
jgi:hypothetical protein